MTGGAAETAFKGVHISSDVHIIGAGLAGSEAAWHLAGAGFSVRLSEMRPFQMTPAHRTGLCAELVCSNSLKSESPNSAPHLLKQEIRRFGSLLLSVAEDCKVPAGQALAVDRERFSTEVTERLSSHPNIQLVREEVTCFPDDRPLLIAAGPLASPALAAALQREVGEESLYFYDAVSPIVDGESLDRSVIFVSSRYGKGGDDYLNCPLDRQCYDRFLAELVEARRHAPHGFEEVKFFEGCLPIEELARRNPETPRFGPMKPVGLADPRTGARPHAVVQLRRENAMDQAFNLVGFQTNLAYPEQERVFRMIPGLGSARFVRLGKMHRNTYVNAPRVLTRHLEIRGRPGVFLAGQICGLEGYVEAIATGLVAALQIGRRLRSEPPLELPRETALGSLCHWIENASPDRYQPANMTFSLLPPADPGLKKAHRRKTDLQSHRVCAALAALEDFLRPLGM